MASVASAPLLRPLSRPPGSSLPSLPRRQPRDFAHACPLRSDSAEDTLLGVTPCAAPRRVWTWAPRCRCALGAGERDARSAAPGAAPSNGPEPGARVHVCRGRGHASRNATRKTRCRPVHPLGASAIQQSARDPKLKVSAWSQPPKRTIMSLCHAPCDLASRRPAVSSSGSHLTF